MALFPIYVILLALKWDGATEVLHSYLDFVLIVTVRPLSDFSCTALMTCTKWLVFFFLQNLSVLKLAVWKEICM